METSSRQNLVVATPADISARLLGLEAVKAPIGAHLFLVRGVLRQPWARATCSLFPNRTLLLTSVDEVELFEVDGLVACAAAVGPVAQDGLEEQHGLRECQAGRWALGHRRSIVRKAWAQVTRAQWWWKPG